MSALCRKIFWQCRLQNVGHFVQTSMWWQMALYSALYAGHRLWLELNVVGLYEYSPYAIVFITCPCLWNKFRMFIQVSFIYGNGNTVTFAIFFITGCNRSCHFDNLLCSQWQIFRAIDSDWFGSPVSSCVYRRSGFHYISYLSEWKRSGAWSNNSKQLLLQLIAGYIFIFSSMNFVVVLVPSWMTNHT